MMRTTVAVFGRASLRQAAWARPTMQSSVRSFANVSRPVTHNFAMRTSTVTRTGAMRFMSSSPTRRVVDAGSATVAGPVGSTSGIGFWRQALGGAAAVGLGCLVVVGANTRAAHDSALTAAVQEAGDDAIYPQYVRDRLFSTFRNMGLGLGLTGVTAAVAWQSGLALRMAAMNPLLSLGLTFGGMMASLFACQAMSVHTNPVGKYLAFGAFTGIMGLSIAPLMSLGGAILGQAALYTAGIVGGLSLVAANSPSDRFLFMGGGLSMALGGMIIASFAPLVFPAAAGVTNAIMLYGGLGVFSLYILYDTSKVISYAKLMNDQQFDPVDRCLGLYLDTVNIFIRIATILGNNKRK